MKIERDERRLDFHDIGREIKQKRERKGMTQEQLAYIIDRDPRTVMYHENDVAVNQLREQIYDIFSEKTSTSSPFIW